jgi:hypothetical protein
MAILGGIFVLFCVGVVTGYSLLYVRSDEAPKKEPAAKVAMQQSQDPGKAAGTAPEGAKDDKENLPQEQNLKVLRQ